ncbi:1-acyl-sn-glycerol-3-phosphate acyltransferase [Altererythrobacter sp. MF3-039]|uniref:1-acyl-sn-glycerol-3-phosphate acyltransferase n=1 Tax=Altererythrobacter sp. MF3-039 TaxID=3252901 RepID=UPI00390CBAC2
MTATTDRDARKAELRAAAARGESTPISPLGWLLFIVRVKLLIFALILLVPLHYIYRTFKYGSPFPEIFLWLAARICGARVRTNGVPLRRDVFFISNHISWLDILALAGASGTAFVAKQELSEVPVVGWLSRLNRTVFVKRENRMGVAGQINALREALEDNWSVTIFPEGTVTDGQSLLPFKTSMMSVLEPPPKDVLVQPVVMDYGDVAEELGWVGDESGINNAKRVLSRRGTFRLNIHFLEPFSPEVFQGRKAIGAEARKRIEGKLVEVLGKPLRPYEYPVDPVRYAPTASPDPNEALAATLAQLGELLGQSEDDWWVIGSAAAFLHGADAGTIADVDVIVGQSDFERLARHPHFQRYEDIDRTHFSSTAIGKWTNAPMSIEVMCELHVRQDDQWHQVVFESRQRVEHSGQVLYVPERLELIRLFERFGRQKDVERAQALRKI